MSMNEKNTTENGKNEKKEKTAAFYTLGCKVNQYETEIIKKEFLENGYKEVDFNEKAEIYVVNTCTVTNMADRKNRKMLRRAKKKSLFNSSGYGMLCTDEFGGFEGNEGNRLYYRKFSKGGCV